MGVAFYLENTKFNQANVFLDMDSSKKTDDLLQDSSKE